MNKLCQRCLRKCKQDTAVVVVECKRYAPAPVQMEFKFKLKKGGLRTNLSKRN